MVFFSDGSVSSTYFGDKTVRHRPIQRVDYSEAEYDQYAQWANLTPGALPVEDYVYHILATVDEKRIRENLAHHQYLHWLRTEGRQFLPHHPLLSSES